MPLIRIQGPVAEKTTVRRRTPAEDRSGNAVLWANADGKQVAIGYQIGEDTDEVLTLSSTAKLEKKI